jgi:aspartyl-tRNA(Asn)/glutamyl-tRNA(Gln) amidotransferase subunit C
LFVDPWTFADHLLPIIYPFFMQLDKNVISRLEKLARLQLDDREKEIFSRDLTRILAMVDKLLELDTSGIPPLASPTEAPQNYRDDEHIEYLDPEAALRNAPKQDGHFFLVPKVIE